MNFEEAAAQLASLMATGGNDEETRDVLRQLQAKLASLEAEVRETTTTSEDNGMSDTGHGAEAADDSHSHSHSQSEDQSTLSRDDARAGGGGGGGRGHAGRYSIESGGGDDDDYGRDEDDDRGGDGEEEDDYTDGEEGEEGGDHTGSYGSGSEYVDESGAGMTRTRPYDLWRQAHMAEGPKKEVWQQQRQQQQQQPRALA